MGLPSILVVVEQNEHYRTGKCASPKEQPSQSVPKGLRFALSHHRPTLASTTKWCECRQLALPLWLTLADRQTSLSFSNSSSKPTSLSCVAHPIKLVGLAFTASAVAFASAQSMAAWNASVPTALVPSNASHAQRIGCRMPPGSPSVWWYNKPNDGPHYCYSANGDRAWSMLNSYRSGGTEQIHWTYTDHSNDFICLRDWDYYATDGTTLIATIRGRTTRIGDTRDWCATNVYRSGGVEDFQWGYCSC